ncbi:actin, clone 302-like [Sipha flava]|uniref:Actin, clone 302-like n=2 Tax=Sipha flava TaxID=143950 RepID=A0A8B8FA78_9HEMI|nr:actin, clone 302-like [Sipha flava]
MSDLRSEDNSLIIDCGSRTCKAGFSLQERPYVVFKTVVGKYEGVSDQEGSFLGDDVKSMRDFLDLKYPVERGIVNNWDDMENILKYTIEKRLKTNAMLHPIMITESPSNHKANREKMTEIVFEKFKAPYFYAAKQAVLALFATGRTTGVAFDSGDGVSHSVPIFDGYAVPSVTQYLNVAGRDLTDYLRKMLSERGYSFATTTTRDIVDDIREKLCYVTPDYGKEINAISSTLDKSYRLPDGQLITIGSERFRCTEALFKPSFLGMENRGIHKIINDSLMKCDVDYRRLMSSHIVMSGGNTLYPGFASRMQKEIMQEDLTTDGIERKIISKPERYHSIWIGGSMLASLPSFRRFWISGAEYAESGPSIVNRKCL